MSSSILELCRAAREDEERSIHLAVRALHTRDHLSDGHSAPDDSESPLMLTASNAAPSLKIPLEGEHLARNLIDIARNRCNLVAETYERQDVQRESNSIPTDEISSLSAFYKRLRELRESHAGGTKQVDDDVEVDANRPLLDVAAPKVMFSGEEAGGRFVDVHENYASFLNLRPTNGEVDYLKYLNIMDDFTVFPNDVKKKAGYCRYLQELSEYLEDFADRVRPLGEVAQKVAEREKKVREQMQEKLKELTKDSKTVEDIEERMTMDEMKNALKHLSLKCGGTQRQRAERLYRLMRSGEGSSDGMSNEVSVLEVKIAYLANDILADERASTIVNVEKKLSLSYEEIEAERLALENAEEGVSKVSSGDISDDEKKIFNPKDIPLGWDGRPIPFWLYKLYGLNHEFKCEICGNATYKGPRAFQRHFTDTQHIRGLRCLGISYSKQYYMVTRIEDAKKLKEKITNDTKRSQFNADVEEEFEDAEGNVMNKKTYGDLVRQGLV